MRGLALHIAVGIVRLVSVGIPGDLRAAWRSEWEAEIRSWADCNLKRRFAGAILVKRAALCIFDVVAVRRARVRGAEHRGRGARSSRVTDLLGDVRFASRSLRKQPALVAIVLLTMAVGIGANTAIFTLLDSIVLRPLPYENPDEIVWVWPSRQQSISKATFDRFSRELESYDALALWTEGAYRLLENDRATLIEGPLVSAGFFDVLGGRAVLGRTFRAGDDRGGNQVVILSYEFWQSFYGGDESVIGRTMEIDGITRTIVGVISPGFDFLQRNADVVVTTQVEPDEIDYGANFLNLVGRLKPGISTETASAELFAAALRRAEEQGANADNLVAEVSTLQDAMIAGAKPTFYVLAGAVMLTLLIVVANVANLLLARSLSREREIALRMALGAGAGRLVRLVLTESVLLAVTGGLLGIAASFAGVRALVALLPDATPRLHQVTVDPAVIGLATLVTVVVGIVVGVVPALAATRSNVRDALGGGGRGSQGGAQRRLKSTLVVGEIVVAVMLLTGSGLLLRSFWNTVRVDPGFEPRGLVHIQINPGPDESHSAERLESYFERLRFELNAVAGVEGVATVHAVPVANSGWNMLTYVEGRRPEPGENRLYATWRPVSEEYLSTGRLSLRSGRWFEDRDRAGNEEVAVINETLAATLFGDGDPIGERIMLPFDVEGPIRVIGVLADVRIRGLRVPAPPTVYRHYPQSSVALAGRGYADRSMLVRVTGDARSYLPTLDRAVREFDPLANILRVELVSDVVAESLAESRAIMILLVVFAGVALLLGGVGIYGVLAYAVGERRKELSIRMALGAGRSSVVRGVLLDGTKLALVGLVLGGVASAWATSFLSAQLFEVSPRDPGSFVAVAIVLLVATLLATLVPARRAADADPMDALREE